MNEKPKQADPTPEIGKAIDTFAGEMGTLIAASARAEDRMYRGLAPIGDLGAGRITVAEFEERQKALLAETP